MKSAIFAKILGIVANVTELSSEQILSKTKTDDLVAARCLFVHYCFTYGIPSVSIAEYLGRRSTWSVSNYLTNYECYRRSSYYFRVMDEKIKQLLANS